MKPFGFQLRTLLVAGLVLLFASGALWLDLTNRGLVWDLLWNLTGESDSPAQILGFSQVIGTQTRVQPDLARHADIQHLPENPFGINTFLQQEVEPAKREQQMQMISEAGFGWIRQEFVWEDIEIHGRGNFWDWRNLDWQLLRPSLLPRWSWQKYDQIVDLAEQYDVNIIARLSQPPTWSQPPGTINPYTPPQDFQDYVNFAVATAERYKGRVFHYQVWNEPNIYPEWGDQMIDPAGYTDLLCRTYQALKAVDPNIVVHTAAIGPTIDLSGTNAYDVLYLQRLYDYGAGDCFDVLSAQGYGLFSGPTDRRMRPFTINFGRHQYLRDVMVANGDAQKPIWLSEAGWNPVRDVSSDVWGWETYGVVSDAESAEYIPLAYERILSEWDYIGVVSYWFFKRADESEKGQSWSYFRLVEPDFTPTVRYEAFQSMTQSGDWREWRSEKSWRTRARERIPQVIVVGLALLFAAWILIRAVIERVSRKSA